MQTISLHICFCSFIFYGTCTKFAAIFVKDDSKHLVATFEFAMNWTREKLANEHVDYEILLVDPNDLHAVSNQVCAALDSENVWVIFGIGIGTKWYSLDKYLQQLSSQLGIPYMSIDDTYQIKTIHTRKGEAHFANEHGNKIWTTVSLFPKWHLVEAISDLIRYWRWQKVTIVYRQSRRIERIVSFLEDEQFAEYRVSLIEVKNADFLSAARLIEQGERCQLIVPKRECIDNRFNRVLLDLSSQDAYAFFLAALQVGIVDVKHWFLLMSTDLHDIDMELYRHNHARIVGLRMIHPKTSLTYPLKSLINLTKSLWYEMQPNANYFPVSDVALTFDAVLMATSGCQKFLRESKANKSHYYARCRSEDKRENAHTYAHDLLQHIRNTSVRGLTGALRQSKYGNRLNFTFQIDLLGYTGVIDNIGYWEPHTDVTVNLSRDSRAQLEANVRVSDELKPHFKVATILERPYVMYRRNHYAYSGNFKFEGFCIDLLAELAKDLGFTYTIHVVRDNKYGNDLGNGTWDGMIGEILRSEADMAVAPLTVNFKRAEVVDFTKPFLSLGISILFKYPDDQTPDLFSFLNPLSPLIWFWIVIAAGCTTIGMYIVARVTPYEWNLNFSCCTAHQPQPACDFAIVEKKKQIGSKIQSTTIELANNYSFWNTVWYVTSTMLKGGCDFGPRAVSTRLLGGTWWVFTLVITSAYTANLAAVLTVSKTFLPIKNLEELANQTAISYGTILGGSTMQFFQESKIKTHMKMWEYMRGRDVFVESNALGVERVLGDRAYAYLMESTSLEYEIQQNCNLTNVGGVLGSKGYGIALRKRSEWTDRISRQLLFYAKMGVIELMKTKWWRSKGGACFGSSHGSNVQEHRLSLNMQNVSGLFVILFVGLIVATLSVVIEFCIRCTQTLRLQRRNSRRNSTRNVPGGRNEQRQRSSSLSPQQKWTTRSALRAEIRPPDINENMGSSPDRAIYATRASTKRLLSVCESNI